MRIFKKKTSSCHYLLLFYDNAIVPHFIRYINTFFALCHVNDGIDAIFHFQNAIPNKEFYISVSRNPFDISYSAFTLNSESS